MRLLFLFSIAAGIVACVAGQQCNFIRTGNDDTRLISCSTVNTAEINLSNKGIYYLQADAFDNNHNLLSLSLSNNQIANIPTGFLANNTALTKLYLAFNQIANIPTGFLDKNIALTHLVLTVNLITNIQPGFLDKNIVLTELHFYTNEIANIPTGFLANNIALTKLSLSKNQIANIPTGFLEKNTNLTHLYLDSNPWNCNDCNVQKLGILTAYNLRNIYQGVFGQTITNIAYCNNTVALGNIFDARTNYTCTLPDSSTPILSTGAIIGISVGAGVVVIGGLGFAINHFVIALAKGRFIYKL